MALFNRDDLFKEEQNNVDESIISPEQPSETTAPESPTIGQGMSAALRQHNIVGSYFGYGMPDTTISPEADFDRFNEMKRLKGTIYQDKLDRFITADNQAQWNSTKARIDKEEEDKQTLGNAGWAGMAYSVAAGVMDPTVFIPVIGQTAKTLNVAKGAAKMAGVLSANTAAVVSGQEAVLQNLQTERTQEETMYAVGTSAILGGILGAGIGAGIARGIKVKLRDEINRAIRGEEPIIEAPTDVKPLEAHSGSAGAGEARLEPSAKSPGEKVLSKIAVPGLKTPIQEVMGTDSEFLKGLTYRLFENIVRKDRNKVGPRSTKEIVQEFKDKGVEVKNITDEFIEDTKGVKHAYEKEYADFAEPTALETYEKIDVQEALAFRKEVEGVYLKYLEMDEGTTFLKGERAGIQAQRQGKMSLREFSEAAARAARRKDPSENPFVNQAVATWRKYLDAQNLKLKSKASPENILKEFVETPELKGREKYFPIIPSRQRMLENRAIIEKNLEDYFVKSGIDEIEAKHQAQEVIESYSGTDEMGSLEHYTMKIINDNEKASFIKERKYDIPDTILEEGLENDLFRIGERYIAQSNSLVRLQTMLDEYGVPTVRKLKDLLLEERANKVARLNRDHPKFAARLKEIDEEYRLNAELFDDFIAMAMNRYRVRGKGDRAIRTLKALNFVTVMGKVTLSSLPDVAMHTLRRGPLSAMKGFSRQGQELLSGTWASKGRELKTMHAHLDMEMNNVLKSIIDPEFSQQTSAFLTDGPGASISSRLSNKLHNAGVRAEWALDWLSSKYGRINLLDYWNYFGKRMAAENISVEIADQLKVFDSLSNMDKQRLNVLGIGKNNYKGILKMIDKYSEESGGALFLNIENWTDIKAKEDFLAAVIKDVDSTVITPGKGDLPRVMQRNKVVSLITQFQSFLASAVNKIIIPAAQDHDARALLGISALIAMGAVSYMVRRKIEHKSIDYSLLNLLSEGIDRSGVLGLLSTPIFQVVLKPFGENSRYTDRAMIDLLLGPSGSIVKSIGKAYSQAGKGEFSEAAGTIAKRMTPYNNLFYLNAVVSQIFGDDDK